MYYVERDSLVELPRVTGKKKTSTLITARSKVRMELAGRTAGANVNESKPTFTVFLPGGDIRKLAATGAETLPVDATKAGEDVYQVSPSTGLTTGEYALAFAGSNEFFAFTVR
jgi:hypothetical protein